MINYLLSRWSVLEKKDESYLRWTCNERVAWRHLKSYFYFEGSLSKFIEEKKSWQIMKVNAASADCIISIAIN